MIYIDKNEIKELLLTTELDEGVPLHVAADMAKDEFNHILIQALRELDEA